MLLRILLLIGVALVLGAIFWLQGAQQQPVDQRLPARSTSATGSSQVPSATQQEPAKVIAIEEPALDNPLRVAEARVLAAEQALTDMELELERFELLIYDIEARGDDPAEYAEQVMPEFQPLLNRFLDAQAELDAAVLAREEAAAGAAAAERQD